MTSTWESQNIAIGMRDAIAAIAENRINALRPETSYAIVQTINREARSATVIFVGETEAVTVAMGSVEPATTGQTVRLGGTIGHRYIEDVLGDAIVAGSDDRYSQIGHVHAGGGELEIELNDLIDVDTATNPPGASSFLGWDVVGGNWEPMSIDLGTAYLPLSGGTLTGPVTFQAAVTMNSTLIASGAVTGASFSGVGTALTSLNASALSTGTIPTARFPGSIPSNTTGTAAAWTTGRLLSVTGDMVGSVTVKGDADMSLSVALQPNSIVLGNDTTGDYVAHIIGTLNQVISNNVVAGEGIIHTLSLPQSIHAAATPTFARMTLSQITGTAPLSITSNTLVTNLNADLLDGQEGSFYQNAGNLNAGTILSARLTGSYTGITGVGTLSTLTVAGVATLGTGTTVGGSTVWHAGNDGAGSTLDAGLLGGLPPADYAQTEMVEAVLGDLLAVGLYDAAAYNGDRFSLLFNRGVQQSITGLTIATGDHNFDMRFELDLPVIPEADLATGEGQRRLIRNNVFLDIVRLGSDDHLLRSTGFVSTSDNTNLTLPNSVTFRAKVRKTSLAAAAVRTLAVHGSGATDEAWHLYMTAGKLTLRVSNNGSTLVTLDVLTAVEVDAIVGTADNTDFYIACSLARTGTQIQARGWGSTDGAIWTAAGPTRTTAFAFDNFFDSPATLNIGGPTATAWDGRIYWLDCIVGTEPNTVLSTVFRFDAVDHPYGGPLTYVDENNRSWTLSVVNTLVHSTVKIQARITTSGGVRLAETALFSYAQTVGKRWQVRGTWTPATDTVAAAHRAGDGVALDAATPAWTQGTAVFAAETMSTIGAVVIGQGVNGPANWSFGGRMFRILIVKNAVTLLDLRNTNITVIDQLVVTPTTGPAMTLSHIGMAMTTMPKPVWAEGPSNYRHNMYWIAGSVGEVDFIDSDFSGRYEVDADDAVELANGDWVVGIDPLFGSVGHEEGTNLTLAQMLFQYVPFSTETYVKAKLQEHIGDVLDPHSAAGYLKINLATGLFAPVIHVHEAEIADQIAIHEGKSDPHPGYLTPAEGNGLYILQGTPLPYEPFGTMLAHTQQADPHPQYVTPAEGNAAYAVVDHGHVEFALGGHTHPTQFEVLSTDGAQSARIFIGDDAPVLPGVGDLWIRTFDISLQAPLAPANLSADVGSTNILITWIAWDPSVAQTGVQVERSLDGLTAWTNILNDTTAPYVTNFNDTGRAERVTYFYRVRATNLAGSGTWGTISRTTTNAPPSAPGSLSVSLVTPSSMRLNWAAVIPPGTDPLHATQPYEVFRNGVSQGFTTSVFWDHTGLPERTAYTLGVRSKDDLGLTSGISTIVGTTSNAAPPAPTGLTFPTWTHHSVQLSWNAVTGIADLSRYQVFLNGGYVGDVYTTSHNFTGLAASTNYSFGVRSVDTAEAPSGLSAISGTTSPQPDTTPPPPVAITAMRPFNNYGELHIQWVSYETTANTIVYRNINGTNWEVIWQGALGAGGPHSVYLGTFGADTTVYSVIHQWDAAGNVRYGDMVAYTLVGSPAIFAPHSSNSYRPTNGGEWNANGSYKVVQGFYSNGALNSYGMWFYGTDFENWWNSNRSITWAEIFVNREGCGNNQQDLISLWMHDMTASPGTTSFWGGAPAIYGPHYGGTVAYNEAKWMPFPVEWAYELMGGTHRGMAVADIATGKPYVCLHPAGAGYSGVVAIHHLG